MITTPRAALKAIFARLLNLPQTAVVWKGENELAPGKPPPSMAITGATNASPIVLTVPQGLVLANGMRATVASVGGNTASNGSWNRITVIDPTHVSLDGSTGNGAYTSGGTIAPIAPFRWGLLRIGSSSREAEGWDFTVDQDNGDGTYNESTVGSRRVILGLEYFSFESPEIIMADDILEDMRTKLWHGEILDAFKAANAAPITYGNVIPLPITINGAERSSAHLDVVVRLSAIDTQVVERDAFNRTNQWIHEVKGTGTVTNEAGAPITQPLDVVGSS